MPKSNPIMPSIESLKRSLNELGYTVRTLAICHGVSEARMRQYLKDNGVEYKKRGNPFRIKSNS